jgi:hypothetical protein
MSNVFIEVGYLPCMTMRRFNTKHIKPSLTKKTIIFDLTDDDSSDSENDDNEIQQTCGSTKYSTVAAAISSYVSNIKSV